MKKYTKYSTPNYKGKGWGGALREQLGDNDLDTAINEIKDSHENSIKAHKECKWCSVWSYKIVDNTTKEIVFELKEA